MVKKLQKMSADKKATPHLSGAVKESAQQIWLAGLGAFSKAQEEGSKVFDTLVKEGLTIQRKTQAVAEEKISEATSKMANMATDIQSKAGHQWDKLENIFEERVAKALNKLGVPSAKDVDALIARIDELNKNVQKMSGKVPAAAKAPAAKKAPRAAAKPTTKPATSKPASAKPATAKRPAAKRAAKPAAATKPATTSATAA
jgi:poly(hydroxyalkanoate) granule-associated protein